MPILFKSSIKISLKELKIPERDIQQERFEKLKGHHVEPSPHQQKVNPLMKILQIKSTSHAIPLNIEIKAYFTWLNHNQHKKIRVRPRTNGKPTNKNNEKKKKKSE